MRGEYAGAGRKSNAPPQVAAPVRFGGDTAFSCASDARWATGTPDGCVPSETPAAATRAAILVPPKALSYIPPEKDFRQFWTQIREAGG